MKKNIKTKNKRSTKILGITVPVIILPIFAFFVISSVYMTIQVATSGAKMAKLNEEKRQLSRKNEEISNILINSSSLSDLGEKAKDFGFKKPELIMYINDDKSVAKLP